VLVAVVALVLLAAATALGRGVVHQGDAVEGPPRGAGPTDDVVLIGDSITEQGDGMFHSTLEPTYRLQVRGRGGYRIDQMDGYAIELAETDPEQVVINLGTNDALLKHPLDKSAASLNRLVSRFPRARCVHIVTVNESMMSSVVPDLDLRARTLNAEIRSVASAHGFDVIDWSSFVAADIKRGSPDGELTSDTIHPNAVGQRKLAKMYKDALDQCR
jgi:hypothetical protein